MVRTNWANHERQIVSAPTEDKKIIIMIFSKEKHA
jgi:hypothetical protein